MESSRLQEDVAVKFSACQPKREIQPAGNAPTPPFSPAALADFDTPIHPLLKRA